MFFTVGYSVEKALTFDFGFCPDIDFYGLKFELQGGKPKDSYTKFDHKPYDHWKYKRTGASFFYASETWLFGISYSNLGGVGFSAGFIL